MKEFKLTTRIPFESESNGEKYHCRSDEHKHFHAIVEFTAVKTNSDGLLILQDFIRKGAVEPLPKGSCEEMAEQIAENTKRVLESHVVKWRRINVKLAAPKIGDCKVFYDMEVTLQNTTYLI